MASEIRIRKIEPSEEAAARRFFASRHAPEHREAAFERRGVRWRWQYWSHPGGEPGIWIAEDGGAIVGIIGTNAVKIRTPLGVVKAVWAGDLLIDPAYRGRGIGKKLVDAWKGSGDIGVGKGYNDIAYALYVSRGFRGVWGFTRMHIALSRARLAAKLYRTGERKSLLRFLKSIHRPLPRLGVPGEYSIDASDGPPAGFEALWRSVAERYRFAFERDAAYLAWRFGAHPTHRYHFLEMRSAAGLEGIAIARIPEGRHPIGVILDLIVDPLDSGAVLALAKGALSFIESRGACAALVDLPPALASTIARAFPCSIRADLSMVLHAVDPELEAAGFYDPAAWYISRSDSDSDY